MGIPTNKYLRTVRRAGPDYGTCDQCGGVCHDHHVTTGNRIYQRDTGEYYISAPSGGAYGHLSCLIKQFGDLISEDTLTRSGNVRIVPNWKVDQIPDTI